MPWSVVQTKSNAAGIVCTNLTRQGFDYYNPKVKERIKLKQGLTWRTVQMFSNYVFVEIFDRWRAVKSTTGVCQLLMSESEKPAIVPDNFIATLKAREDKDGLIILNKSKFAMSQRVQIKSGPFAYESGLFDGARDRDRVFVLLSLLGSKRRVEVQEDNLVAA